MSNVETIDEVVIELEIYLTYWLKEEEYFNK